MHPNSLPPGDRDEIAEPTPQLPLAVQGLAAELHAHAQDHGLSNGRLAKSLGYSTAVVSQYLRGIYPGNVEQVDRRVRDYLRAFKRRRNSGVDTVRCSTTRKIATAIEAIRRTNDVGVILAEAGLGKTRALDLYREQAPTSLILEVRGWSNDKHSIEASVAEAVGGYDGKRKRAVWLAEKLAGGGRTLIVDDAHKLTRPALQWLFDFHDATGCPLALCGTQELEHKVRDDAQRFSRTGLLVRVSAEESDEALIGHLITSLAPAADERELTLLHQLCSQVAEQHGHYRAVYKQLKLAAEIKEGKPELGWSECFRAAHTRLFREYKLTLNNTPTP